MSKKTIDELLEWENRWYEEEIMVEGSQRNAWLEEGVQLYNQFLQLDKKEPRYSIMLADLYLQMGRDKKIRMGNHKQAYKTLRLASIYSPTKPDAFYHLSFVFANERKWEAALFYGKEALENKLDEKRKIKLFCNLALGYSRIGYPHKSMVYMNLAKTLDEKNEHEWFMQLYKDKIKHRSNEHILLQEASKDRKAISRKQYERVKEEAMEGKYVALDLTKDEKYVYAMHDAIRLERKEGEILGYLIDHQMNTCSKQEIEEAIWLDRNVSPSTVKRYIASLRRKLSQAMGQNDISECVLVTNGDGYEWKANIQSIVFR